MRERLKTARLKRASAWDSASRSVGPHGSVCKHGRSCLIQIKPPIKALENIQRSHMSYQGKGDHNGRIARSALQ